LTLIPPLARVSKPSTTSSIFPYEPRNWGN
jgi:hypothetical protein